MINNLLWPVISAGLIDSINPCAITILLLFIAIMFGMHKSREKILVMGFFYIAAIYVTYLAIGLGLLKVTHLFGTPHFMGKLGAIISITVGIIALKEYFFPNWQWPINLRISIASRQLISDWTHKATIPAAIVVGFLVGVCEFPCSGAIYLATIGLISVKATFLKGVIYLLLYNVMFILPLAVIYLLATNRLVTEKMITWQESHGSLMKLVSGLFMVGLGIIIFWII